jgi:hypothetical protein
MSKTKSILKGAFVAALAAGSMIATGAAAATYVVCNTYNECWKVHQRYHDYPADLHVTFHNEAWWAANQRVARWHWEADPTDDHGWYDKTGVWVAFTPPP